MSSEDIVVMYSTRCPRCEILEEKLKQKKIHYTVCEDQQTMLDMGFETVPMLAVNDTVYNFKEAFNMLEKM